MLKGYKFRIFPDDKQTAVIKQTIGNCRWLYNYFLDERETFYKVGLPTPSEFDCNKQITQLKKVFPWLKLADSKAQQHAVNHLYDGYKRFFKKKARHPQAKKKSRSKWSYTTDGVALNVGKDFVVLPKLDIVKAVIHRKLPANGKIKSATVAMTRSGKFYCTMLVETPDKQKQPASIIESSKVLGLDYSSHDFYVDNFNRSPEYQHWYRAMQKKLRRNQKKLSRMLETAKRDKRLVADSHNLQKQFRKVACIHEKIANRRLNFTNQLSAMIAKSYDAVVVEDINLRGMAGSLKLGKATNDNGFGIFRQQLEYKMAERGKYFIKVDKFFPSSQTCSVCGCQSKATKDLSVREWTCPHCGAHLLRDQNAAINLKTEGIRILEQEIAVSVI